ncbi:MAG: hypothetical protein ACXIUP_06935 [Microcella sp.]
MHRGRSRAAGLSALLDHLDYEVKPYRWPLAARVRAPLVEPLASACVRRFSLDDLQK